MNEPREIFYLAGKRQRKMRGTLVEDRMDLAGEREITIRKRTNTATIKADDIVEEKSEGAGVVGDDQGRDQATVEESFTLTPLGEAAMGLEILKGGEAYRRAVENASNQTRLESQHLPQPSVDVENPSGFNATIPIAEPEMAQGAILLRSEPQDIGGGNNLLPKATQSERASSRTRKARKLVAGNGILETSLPNPAQLDRSAPERGERTWASFAGLEHYGENGPQAATVKPF